MVAFASCSAARTVVGSGCLVPGEETIEKANLDNSCSVALRQVSGVVMLLSGVMGIVPPLARSQVVNST
jgi:hypothetical protein